MTAKEYLKNIPREKLENLIVNYCCPDCIEIETELSVDNDFCSDYGMGDCDKCWNINIVTNENE